MRKMLLEYPLAVVFGAASFGIALYLGQFLSNDLLKALLQIGLFAIAFIGYRALVRRLGRQDQLS